MCTHFSNMTPSSCWVSKQGVRTPHRHMGIAQKGKKSIKSPYCVSYIVTETSYKYKCTLCGRGSNVQIVKGDAKLCQKCGSYHELKKY